MKLPDILYKSFRKHKLSGKKELVQQYADQLEQLFYQKIIYDNLLSGQLEVLTRSEINTHPTCVSYDTFRESIRVRSEDGLRNKSDPDRYHPGDRSVCRFPNSIVLDGAGVGITSTGRVIGETINSPERVENRLPHSISRSFAESGVLRTMCAFSGSASPDRHHDVASVAVPAWKNYYHWVIECLPRIRLLEKYGNHTGQYPVLIIPRDSPDWLKESIDMIEYTGKIASIEGSVISVDSLVVPTFPDPTSIEYQWLRKRMLNDVPYTEAEFSKRVYISREDATVRRVSNKKRLNRLLDTYDIHTYSLSSLSVREQIDLFSQAKLIVSPHGAGLTNILFADQAAVIEMFGQRKASMYDRMAEHLHHDYRMIECEQSGVDIVPKMSDVEQAIQELLG